MHLKFKMILRPINIIEKWMLAYKQLPFFNSNH